MAAEQVQRKPRHKQGLNADIDRAEISRRYAAGELSFAELAQLVRRELQVSTNTMAQLLQLSESRVKQIERGRGDVTINTATRYASLIGMTFAPVPAAPTSFQNVARENRMHPIDLIYTFATNAAIPDGVLKPIPAGESLVCACCGRPSSQWVSQHYATFKETYQCHHPARPKDATHCPACHTLYVSNIDVLGAESASGAKSIKIGMLTGCALWVDRLGAVLYANPGFYAKLKAAKRWPEVIELVQLNRPMEIIKDLRERLTNGTGRSLPGVFISDLGRQKEELVANLSMTTSPDLINACSKDGVEQINASAAEQLLTALAPIKKAKVTRFKQLFAAICRGDRKPDDQEMAAFCAEHPDVVEAIASLPADPYARLSVIRFI